MQIYVVVPGDNVDEISTRYGCRQSPNLCESACISVSTCHWPEALYT